MKSLNITGLVGNAMQINKIMVAMIALVGLLLVGGIPEVSGTHLGEGELGYDDGEVDSQCSKGDDGHAVFFSNDRKLNIYGIKMCGARYDDGSRKFDIEIWDNNLKTLYSASYDYTDFFPDTYPSRMDNSDLKWVTINVPNIEVNDDFYISIFTYSGPPSGIEAAHDPHAPKGGIVIGRDSDTKSGNSFIVDKNPNRIVDWPTTWNIRQDDTDWMIRVVTSPTIEIGMYINPWTDNMDPDHESQEPYYSLASGKYTELIGQLKKYRIKRIFVPVYYPGNKSVDYKGIFLMENKGTWNYPSEEEPVYPLQNNNKPYFDLQKLIDEAKKEGIEVHATINAFGTGLSYARSVDPADLTHLAELKNVTQHLITNYDGLTGIHLDHIRYMTDDENQNPRLLAGENGYKDITRAVKEIHNTTDRDNIGIVLSAAVYAKTERDYATMLKAEGQNYADMSEYLDFISPMAYHYPDFDPSWVGDVTSFVRRKVNEKNANCAVITTIQGYYEIVGVNDAKLPVIKKPGRDEIFNAGKSALDDGTDGVNVFIYPAIYSPDEWQAIMDLSIYQSSASPDVPDISKPPEKSIVGFEALFAIVIILAAVHLLKRER
jgi:hypothetical protein